ncbi:hypothetical protein V8F06_009268 [Rhypophila decipiens]
MSSQSKRRIISDPESPPRPTRKKDAEEASAAVATRPLTSLPWRGSRLPYELWLLVSEFLTTPQVGKTYRDLASLSRLARTCKSSYEAFQPILFRNIEFPHINISCCRDRRKSNERLAGLLRCISARPYLLHHIRTIDFTDISATDFEPLPEDHYEAVDRHVKAFNIRRVSKHHAAPPKIFGEDGYPVQLTVLLLLVQATVTKVRFTVPKPFWVKDSDREQSSNSEARKIGMVLKEMPKFPNLEHAILYFAPRPWHGDPRDADWHSDLRDSDVQADCRLFFAVAPSIRTLSLRGCHLDKLAWEIPATVTTLTLEHSVDDNAWRNHFNPSPAATCYSLLFPSGSSVKSLTVSFRKSTYDVPHPGNCLVYFRCHHNGITSPVPRPYQAGGGSSRD